MCNTCVDEMELSEVKEYINYQTGEKLDLKRVMTLPDKRMLKKSPEFWIEWNFEKNNELGLNVWTLYRGSAKKSWWKCAKCGSEEFRYIRDKEDGIGCKKCNPKAIIKTNSLLITHANLAKEWHPTKNGKLTPQHVTSGSNKEAWWICSKCSSEYEKIIYEKVDTINCPYCSGYNVNHTNSLATLNPSLASEWHPTLNGDLTPHDVTSSKSIKVWWLGKCGHEWDAYLSNRNNRGAKCPYCTNRKLLVGFNDIWTTNPDMASLLDNPEDGYKYGIHNNSIKLNWKCPECGKVIKNKPIGTVCKYGISCNRCSDGKSLPERFLSNFLSVFNTEFINDSAFIWSDRKRYDFYIPSLNMIIETHGMQHYKNSFEAFETARTLEEEQANDKYKYELAIKNGIKPENYIVIDCRYSEFKYIKNNIMNSRLTEIFDLSDVDWNYINKMCSKSLVFSVANEWNKGVSVNRISHMFSVGRMTTVKYLKQGTEIGICKYTVEESRKRRVD